MNREVMGATEITQGRGGIASRLFGRLFSSRRERDRFRPLYAVLVERARDPRWYTDGGVPDTRTGRFAVLSALLAVVLLRLEGAGTEREAEALISELFVEDMDGHLREDGIGDQIVGKHVRQLMGAAAGRHQALRLAGDDHEAIAQVVSRNFYGGEPPAAGALRAATDLLAGFRAAVALTPLPALKDGALPPL